MRLSIVIPAYNEEERIGSGIRKIVGYMKSKGHEFELIVVNDGSKDNTVEVARKAGGRELRIESLDRNHGKGYAVWKGLSLAKYDHVLFSDADLSTPIEEFERLAVHLGEADVIIASRNLPDSRILVKQPWLRSRLGRTFPFFVRALVLPGIKDSQCGFKLFTRRAVIPIVSHQSIFDFGFDVEQLFIAKLAGLKIKEVGVRWENAEGSKVRPIRDARKMLVDLLKIRLNQLKGRYNDLHDDPFHGLTQADLNCRKTKEDIQK